jgi:hypothetical protein
MSYAEQHLRETNEIVQKLDPALKVQRTKWESVK